MTRDDLLYAAGLYEGEGYAATNPLGVRIKMTDRDVLEGFRNRVGYGTVSGPWKASGLGKKDVWEYKITGRRACALFVAMFPFLGERRQGQVATAIRWWLGQPLRKKLTAAQLMAIRSAPTGYGTGRRLARQFGVTDSRISQIRGAA